MQNRGERSHGASDPLYGREVVMQTDERRRALLIGSPAFGLQGVLPDVGKMRRELEAWGFRCTECVGEHATRDGILCALRELVAGTRAGDVVAIYYSGHGGRCRLAAEGTSQPPAWNYLVPMDHHRETAFRGIAEFELGGFLHELAERTLDVTVILDCCHAAGTFRGDERVRAVPELSSMPRPLQDALDELAKAPRVLHPDGHRDVVRVLATSSDASAFEFTRNGQPSGYLTTELCAALAEARQAPMTWDSIIRQVRERIMARRGSDTQRPEVEGPRHRLPFSLHEPVSRGEHATLVLDDEGAPWIRAGRLQGLREGDRVEVHDGSDAVAATGTIAVLFEDSARLELDPRRSGGVPRLGSTVVSRSPSLRRTVRVGPEALGVPGLLSGLEQSQRLSVVSTDDATFSVQLGHGRLHVRGPAWLRRVPRPATPEGVQALVADLDGLARAEILLHELESPRGLPQGPDPIRWTFELFVTEPSSRSPRPLRPGEVLQEGTRLYAELRHLTRAKPTLYVNVLDRGITGRLALINQSEPAGVQLRAQQTRWVGRRAHGGPPGLRLAWPEQVPRDGLGRESLWCVVSQRPLDLRPLLEGPGARPPDRNRDGPADGLGTALHWAVARVEFSLQAV
jgi:hypothetical protein